MNKTPPNATSLTASDSLAPRSGGRARERGSFDQPGSTAKPPSTKTLPFLFLLVLLLFSLGCRREMYDQPRGDPLKSSDFFADGAASRPLPPHTVAQENFHADASYDTGRTGTNFLADVPFPVTRAVLERGQECFDIYCAVCHGRTGQGRGIVVQRGFPAPPSYDIERLREKPPGYFYDVITRGYGAMFSYANRVQPDDRWAIAAYIRALQLSQHATLADVPPGERVKLEASLK